MARQERGGACLFCKWILCAEVMIGGRREWRAEDEDVPRFRGTAMRFGFGAASAFCQLSSVSVRILTTHNKDRKRVELNTKSYEETSRVSTSVELYAAAQASVRG